MPLILLQNGVVSWGSRQSARVYIKSRFTDMTVGELEVSLDLPRRCFMTEKNVRDVLAHLLARLVATVHERKRAARQTVTIKHQLPFVGLPWARLRMESPSFNAMRHHYSKRAITLGRRRALAAQEAFPDLSTEVKRMATLWFYQCVGPTVVDLIRTPPRSKGGAQGRLLTKTLPSAFLAAQTLVRLADRSLGQLRGDAEELFPQGAPTADLEGLRTSYVDLGLRVQARIKEILQKDDTVTTRRRPARPTKRHAVAVAVALVDRAFQDAWKTAKHPGLLANRDPAEWFQKYLYGRKYRRAEMERLDLLRQHHPADYLGQLWAWGQAFLT